jgi:hypothetical protein
VSGNAHYLKRVFFFYWTSFSLSAMKEHWGYIGMSNGRARGDNVATGDGMEEKRLSIQYDRHLWRSEHEITHGFGK